MKNTFMMFITNKYIYIPMILWFFIQVFKVVHDLYKTKKLNFRRILGAGGMPSSHSAVVVSISTLIGKNYGVDSAIFALSLIFSLVVMYDACGVRRAAGKQAKLLNEIVNTPGLSSIEVKGKLQEALGHTPVQVFVGALIGLIAGLVL